MRTPVGITMLVVALLAAGPAAADARSVCIAACETTAQTCMRAAHDKYDACRPAANKGCVSKPPSDAFDCLSGALKACTTTHSSETEPCRATFAACYAACGARPAGQFDFWCELDGDTPASTIKVRKEVFCAGTPGAKPVDQHAGCMKLYTPTDPAMGFSLGCTVLP